MLIEGYEQLRARLAAMAPPGEAIGEVAFGKPAPRGLAALGQLALGLADAFLGGDHHDDGVAIAAGRAGLLVVPACRKTDGLLTPLAWHLDAPEVLAGPALQAIAIERAAGRLFLELPVAGARARLMFWDGVARLPGNHGRALAIAEAIEAARG